MMLIEMKGKWTWLIEIVFFVLLLKVDCFRGFIPPPRRRIQQTSSSSSSSKQISSLNHRIKISWRKASSILLRMVESANEGTLSNPPKLDENECYYSVLEIDPTADAQEIKKSYERLVAMYHPRTKTNLKEIGLSNRQMHVINQAYAVIHNPMTRKLYDERRVNGQYGALAGVLPDDSEVRANSARIEQVIKQNTKKLWENYIHHPEQVKNITNQVLAEDFIPHKQHELHDPKREVFRSLERRYEQVDQEANEIYGILLKLRKTCQSPEEIEKSLLYLYRLKESKTVSMVEGNHDKDEVAVYRRAKMKDVIEGISVLIRDFEEFLREEMVDRRSSDIIDDDGDGSGKKRSLPYIFDGRDYSEDLHPQSGTQVQPQRDSHSHYRDSPIRIDNMDRSDSSDEDERLKDFAESFFQSYAKSDMWKSNFDGNDHDNNDHNSDDDNNSSNNDDSIGDIYNNDFDYEAFLETADEYRNIADVFSAYDARDFSTGKALHDPLLLQLLGIKNSTTPDQR